MSHPLPLFVDTGGLYAVFNEDDVNHEQTNAVFDGMKAGEYGDEKVRGGRRVRSGVEASGCLWSGGRSKPT
jgi:hypothetical protein